jgi:hypothetical protein
MVSVPVHCPYCHSTEVIKAGTQANGTQRISVKMSDARGGSFSSTTRIAAGCLRSAARWSTWHSTAAASATPPAQHTVRKLTMQKSERKHLTLRTRLKRLARKTLCFSRSRVMHDLLIGLYMNRVEFGCVV